MRLCGRHARGTQPLTIIIPHRKAWALLSTTSAAAWCARISYCCRPELASRRADASRIRVDSCSNFAQVTVVNPLFLKLMQQYTPTGIMSTLAQEVFADIKVSKRFSVGPTLITFLAFCSLSARRARPSVAQSHRLTTLMGATEDTFDLKKSRAVHSPQRHVPDVDRWAFPPSTIPVWRCFLDIGHRPLGTKSSHRQYRGF